MTIRSTGLPSGCLRGAWLNTTMSGQRSRFRSATATARGIPGRQDAGDPVGTPALPASPGDGNEPAGVLNSVGIGAEDQVGETVPVQVSRRRAETPQHRQGGVGEVPAGVELGPGGVDVGDAVVSIVEDQIQVAVLVQIEAVDGADGSVSRDVDVLAGGVQTSIGEVLEAVFDPTLCPHGGESRRQPENQQGEQGGKPVTGIRHGQPPLRVRVSSPGGSGFDGPEAHRLPGGTSARPREEAESWSRKSSTLYSPW